MRDELPLQTTATARLTRRHHSESPVPPPAAAAAQQCDGEDGAGLNLMEQVVLLSVNDRTGQLSSLLNDTISYVLRGCLLMELGLLGRIRLDPAAAPAKKLADRHVLVRDPAPLGYALLDETLRCVARERLSVNAWMDSLSGTPAAAPRAPVGETWNPLRSGYQLKQVRERIAKGLVDKGVLSAGRPASALVALLQSTAHPLARRGPKDALVHGLAVALSPTPQDARPGPRAVALVCAAYAANVLEPALSGRNRPQSHALLPKTQIDGCLRKAQQWLHAYAVHQEPAAEEMDVVSAVLSIFCRLDTLLY